MKVSREPEFKEMGKAIKLKRMEKGISQAQIAEALGYSSPQFVSNWERGVSSPPMNALLVIIEMLGMDKVEVFELLMTEREKQLKTALNLSKSRVG